MSRNRYRRAMVRSRVLPGALTLTLIAAAVLCLSYLWLRNQCELLGRQIKDLEQTKLTLERRVANEESHWSSMKSAEGVERLLQSHNLAMALPAEKDVVRLRPQAWTAEERASARGLPGQGLPGQGRQFANNHAETVND